MYKCLCGKEYEKKNSFSVHIHRCKIYQESKNNKYECKCGFISDNYQKLNNHYRWCLIHRDGKPPLKKEKGYKLPSQKGKIISVETRLKLSLANKGKPSGKCKDSEKEIERRKKISIAASNRSDHKNSKWYSLSNGTKVNYVNLKI